MTAAEILQLVTEEGPDGVAQSLGCSRRQAEQVATVAAKAVREGRELPESYVLPTGTRRYNQRPPMPGRALSTEETANLPGAYIDPAMRSFEAQHEANRQATIIRNVENGYVEWLGQVADPNERARLERLLKAQKITVPKELV